MGKPKEQQEQGLGKKVRVIVLGKDKTAECHYCGTSKRRGMFVEYQTNIYCNDDCIKMELMTDAGD